MNPIRPHVASPLLAVALASACLGAASPARAQGFGPDPFRPYNSQYDSYVFGVSPGALDGVGNPSINRQGVRNANRFREAVEGLDNANRYDRSFRDYDQDRRRVYQPNAAADARGNARRARASDLYFQYLNEKSDPRKRAELFKEYTEAQSDVARGVADDPGARGARRSSRSADAIPPAPGRRGSTERFRERIREKEAAVPAAPDGFGSRSAESARPKRSSRPSVIPPPPSGDEPSPSEVLDRASRSPRTAPPAPPADLP